MADESSSILVLILVCLLFYDYLLLNLTVLVADFNVDVETDTDTWKGVIEQHGVAGMKNGRYLLQLCCSNGLRIMKTFFQLKKGSQVYIKVVHI